MSQRSGAHDAGAPPGSVRVRASLPIDQRRNRWAPLASLLLHAAAIALLVRVGLEEATTRGNPYLDLAQRPGGGGGGGTGGGFVSILPPPPPPPVDNLEVPVVVPTTIPEPEPEPVEEPVVEPVVPPPPTPPAGSEAGNAGTGGGTGGGQGSGSGPGQGSGVGPGSGGGSGGGTGGGGRHGTPPENRTMILPPLDGFPRALRGKSIEVTFYIDVQGTVTDLVITPPITDRRYARKFDEDMRQYRFRPAKDADGRVVAGVFVFTFTYPES